MSIPVPRSMVMVLVALLLAACAGPAPRDESSDSGATPGGTPGVEAETATIDGYRLGQGDRIAIQVFDEPDLTMEATVSASGVINYSYLGDLQVAGRTPVELERAIANTLREGYLVNPSVNVSVVGFRSFFINGEVRSPGSYPYQPGLTLNKAIALAGGLTDRASTRRMFVVRAQSQAQAPEKVGGGAPINPGDTILIQEGFF